LRHKLNFMSKRNINTQPSASASILTVADAPSLPTTESPIWQKAFWLAFTILAAFMLYLSTQTGINADEDYQAKYSESLVKWYASGGKDTTAVHFVRRGAPMYVYGGFFEVIAGATNHAIGTAPESLAYHQIRHILVCVFGLLALLFTALAVKEIANWRAALMAALLMGLSPYYLGNAIMNPKDIPFAAGFAISIYYMIRFFKTITDEINWKVIVGLILGLGLAFGTRAGGLLLFAYFGLFTLIHIIKAYGLNNFFSNKPLFLKYLKAGLIIFAGGYIVGILFWPFALMKPFSNPFIALSEFEKLGNSIRVLYMGDTFMSNEVPSSYPIKSIFQTTPLIVLSCLALAIPFIIQMFRRYGFLMMFITLFVAIFPIFYVIIKHSNMYNQWRHLLFVYPGLMMLAALATNTLYDFLSPKNKNFGSILLVIVGLGLVPPTLHILQNKGLSYIYYNEVVGGVKPQLGNFETDYWGVSIRQGIEHLEQKGILSENMTTPITIVSNMGYALECYTKKYGDKVKWVYADYKQRYNTKIGNKPSNLRWDYGLFISLFVPADQLRSGNWPMKSQTIHTVEVAGTPVLAVMKQDTTQRLVKAREALDNNNLALATELLQAEVAAYPDNEIALNELIMCQLNAANFAAAKTNCDILLKISTQNANAYYYKALAQAQMQDINGALNTARVGLKIAPDSEPLRNLLGQLMNKR
jgi:hypothetical protein